MSLPNQYQTPQSNVDQQTSQQYGEAKIFSVSGRIGRMRFLAYAVGTNLLVGIPIRMMEFAAASTGAPQADMMVAGLAIIGVVVQLVLYFMFAIQRSHDMNTTGWLSLILLIPLIGFLVFVFAPGTRGENRYGLQPPPNTGGVIALALIMPIIAIIGIIAAIAIPAYQSYVEKANQQYEQPR